MERVVLIFNSYTLRDYILEAEKEIGKTNLPLIVKGENRYFSMPNHSKEKVLTEGNGSFEFEIASKQIYKLRKLLEILEQQPIYLTFDPDHEWIYLRQAIV